MERREPPDSRPVRVLVIDDSAFMRKVLTELLSSDPGIAVVGTARDGVDGVQKALQLRPDVITLDVEMPRLDGYGTLKELMEKCPTPVVMVSSHTRAGAEATIRALALGAVDVVAKPSGPISLDMHKVRDELVRKVRAAAGAAVRPRRVLAELPPLEGRRIRAPGVRPQGEAGVASRLVVIGCSTGGPGALHQVLPRLPADLPVGILVVQHMPPGFTRSLAERLNEISAIAVKEAEEGDPILPGQALVAPGGYHMLVGPGGRVRLDQSPPVHGVRPAVDPTLESAVREYGGRVLAAILTGMGYDGARGALAVKKAGGLCVAEDASTCVVYGMPRAVVTMGLADAVLPIHEVAAAIVRYARGEAIAREGVRPS
ncbi:MAG: chemotaxis response regulator protein-glutamate methylesterase [Firmicutes bacterium]|nr:chemotaxis response regulator protein-glutamate methylesterase [Bacillota bacterium]